MYKVKSNTVVPVCPRSAPQAKFAPLKPPLRWRSLISKRREPSSSNLKFATPPALTVVLGMAWLPLRIARRSAVGKKKDERSGWCKNTRHFNCKLACVLLPLGLMTSCHPGLARAFTLLRGTSSLRSSGSSLLFRFAMTQQRGGEEVHSIGKDCLSLNRVRCKQKAFFKRKECQSCESLPSLHWVVKLRGNKKVKAEHKRVRRKKIIWKIIIKHGYQVYRNAFTYGSKEWKRSTRL